MSYSTSMACFYLATGFDFREKNSCWIRIDRRRDAVTRLLPCLSSKYTDDERVNFPETKCMY